MEDQIDYKEIAEYLWGLLDSIDTLPDMLKPSTLEDYILYYKMVTKRHEKRWAISDSNGHEIIFTRNPPPKPEQSKDEKEAGVMTRNIKPHSNSTF